MLADFLFLAGGIALLFVGAEFLVRGASALALRLGISPLVVGLTVVAFGTSAPELIVSVQAALSGSGGIAVGNVVGSNIANVALILGVAALIRPLRVEAQLVRFDMPLMVAVTGVLTLFLWDKTLSRPEASLLLTGFVSYIAFTLHQARRSRSLMLTLDAALPPPASSRLQDALYVVGGLGALVLGSTALVRGAVGIAEALGVPDAVIGLTLVAVGTSLPELATSALAAFRGKGDLAVGNVVGSNLFNALGILGTSALVRPLIAPGLTPIDLGVVLVTAVLVLPLAWTGFALDRREGAFLLALYVIYTVSLLT